MKINWKEQLKLSGLTPPELLNYKNNAAANSLFRRCGAFVLNKNQAQTIKKPYELTNTGASMIDYIQSMD